MSNKSCGLPYNNRERSTGCKVSSVLLFLASAILLTTKPPSAAGESLVTSQDFFASSFLARVDEAIGTIASSYPQLADWAVIAQEPQVLQPGPHGWSPGKAFPRGTRELFYSHGRILSTSSDYRDGYGENGCTIDVLLYTQEEFFRVAGAGVKTQIFGEPLGEFRLVVSVITEHPEVSGLEERVVNIIRSVAKSVQQPSSAKDGQGKAVTNE